mmetsp:Transcript_90279/g.162794  ORF Transcript_90279/g.162794 Transcript_90279/m.162794 type:complete len:285 (-) Transcript_90279:163-1017(-)
MTLLNSLRRDIPCWNRSCWPVTCCKDRFKRRKSSKTSTFVRLNSRSFSLRTSFRFDKLAKSAWTALLSESELRSRRSPSRSETSMALCSKRRTMPVSVSSNLDLSTRPRSLTAPFAQASAACFARFSSFRASKEGAPTSCFCKNCSCLLTSSLSRDSKSRTEVSTALRVASLMSRLSSSGDGEDVAPPLLLLLPTSSSRCLTKFPSTSDCRLIDFSPISSTFCRPFSMTSSRRCSQTWMSSTTTAPKLGDFGFCLSSNFTRPFSKEAVREDGVSPGQGWPPACG